MSILSKFVRYKLSKYFFDKKFNLNELSNLIIIGIFLVFFGYFLINNLKKPKEKQ